jgi:hypothetical protein
VHFAVRQKANRANCMAAEAWTGTKSKRPDGSVILLSAFQGAMQIGGRLKARTLSGTLIASQVADGAGARVRAANGWFA